MTLAVYAVPPLSFAALYGCISRPLKKYEVMSFFSTKYNELFQVHYLVLCVLRKDSMTVVSYSFQMVPYYYKLEVTKKSKFSTKIKK
jgi:hypothetical protein